MRTHGRIETGTSLDLRVGMMLSFLLIMMTAVFLL